jgi:histidyl-tRNA synthetase
LRILDCKNRECIEVIRRLDIQHDYLCTDCQPHFRRIKEGLDSLEVKYEVDPYLVRGLDYYTRTVFEIIHPELGAQDALGAGGRYDNLISDLGGPKIGAIGFAFGVERLLLVSRCQGVKASKEKLVYIITLGREAKRQGLRLLANLRGAGISADTDYEGKSLKGAMRRANDLKALYVLILGDDELKKNIVTFKDMVSGEQKEIKRGDLIKELKC